jgi:hypothetical protein
MATKAKAAFNEIPMTRASQADPRPDHEISFLRKMETVRGAIGRLSLIWSAT